MSNLTHCASGSNSKLKDTGKQKSQIPYLDALILILAEFSVVEPVTATPTRKGATITAAGRPTEIKKCLLSQYCGSELI